MASRIEGPMALPIGICIGLVTLIVLYLVIPIIGGSMENAMPTLGATSEWNSTYNSDLPTAAGLAETNLPLVGLLVLAITVGGAILYFKNMAQ